MLLCSITSAAAQVSVGIGLPGVSIGINLPVYPQLVVVPGYPVYYAPRVNSNYFFYDGMYWVYAGDNWYASSWYNGPWGLVPPEAVPLFILRVPVRYYRHAPAYFRGWRSDAPPRWGEHWGDAWVQRRSGWDTWNRSAAPAPAPLPVYQRQYSGDRYPGAEQQQVLQSRNYRYQPHDAVVQQHYQAQRVQSAPAPSPPATQAMPREKSSSQQAQRVPKPPSSREQDAAPAKPAAVHAPPQPSGPIAQPKGQPPQQGAVQHEQKATRSGQDKGPQGQDKGPKGSVQEPKAQHQTQQPAQAAAPREQQAPKSQGQDKAPQGKAAAQEPKQGQDKGPQGKAAVQEPKQGQEKGRDKGEQKDGERKN
jgi:hypothetical protein